ncbi:hypothetical protein [Pseudomonas frederiksbergensis]|nr:hypothetical protein [Pseudomonas frederiksbergensis]
MRFLLIALLQVTFLSGCSSTPREKTEFEKQLDAVPMPTTEAERLNECKRLGWAALDATRGAPHNLLSLFKKWDSTKLEAIDGRMTAMNCTRAESYPWIAGPAKQVN